ncbi:MAG TPA: glycoside hydrolase family 43 protein [Verrucomicrobiae bacterium]|nr:glycoside hydrolase family 43 protein [Verrucomicrobiae bacterium]
MPPHSADPWMILHGGFYYYTEVRDKRRIYIRRSRDIGGIGLDPGVCVWTAPLSGGNSDNVWAPELHLIDGKWFIYYAADNGRNENHRMWVLESEGADPCGKYRCRGRLETGGWAIDGTVMTLDDGRRYFIWSGWPGRRNGQQNLYIAGMRDPMTIAGPRVLLTTPDRAWERVAMPICEGPQVLRRNGDLFIVYSASGSWTPDYCLGMLHNRSKDVLNPGSWTKHGPVFRKTEQVWGVGHCSFVKSLCQTEDWIVYHAKSSLTPGWDDRDVHAKRFIWNSDGFPEFGLPVPRTVPLTPSSPTLTRPRVNRVAA